MTQHQRSFTLMAIGIGLCLSLSPAWAQTMQEKLKSAIEAGEIAGLHSTVVMLEGEKVAEAYFAGHDERWGRPLGLINHSAETLHDVRSVTKSVVGLLYGIALGEGSVPPLNASLLDSFPQYADLPELAQRRKITIEHVLSMKMGIEWDESLPYSDRRNSEIAMERANDRYRFVLSRPMVEKPGTQWTYNGGAVALIGQLIANGTGMQIDAFAKEKLFGPLGITSFEWVRGADNVPSAASGLRLTARDLARIGVMVAQRGRYDGKQIVPASWLDTSFRKRATIAKGFDYGLLWYLAKAPGGDQILVASGNGGQRLTVQPKVGFVVSTFAGNYNAPDAWKMAVKVLVQYAIPEVVRKRTK
jgi:CubicO group peptidase (beta-lactamase class C family)